MTEQESQSVRGALGMYRQMLTDGTHQTPAGRLFAAAAAGNVQIETLARLCGTRAATLRRYAAGTQPRSLEPAMCNVTTALEIAVNMGVLPAPQRLVTPIVSVVQRALSLRVERDEANSRATEALAKLALVQRAHQDALADEAEEEEEEEPEDEESDEAPEENE